MQMTGETSFLLLQSLNETADFDFENDLLISMRESLPDAQYFCMDNLSDGITVGYAKTFIDQADILLIICDEMKNKKLGSLLPILNLCVKRKATRLIAVGKCEVINPFIKMMKGTHASNLDELKVLFKHY